jgi:hypothetical protein
MDKERKNLKNRRNEGSEVFTAVTMKNTVFYEAGCGPV